jgi:hypothetical protein
MPTSGLQQFDTRANVRLEVFANALSASGSLRNLIQNPDGALGAWWWMPGFQKDSHPELLELAPVIVGGRTGIQAKDYTGNANYGVISPRIAVSPGDYVQGNFDVLSVSSSVKWQLQFFDAADNSLAISTGAAITAAGNGNLIAPTVAPANTAGVRLGVIFTGATANQTVNVTNLNLFRTATNAALGAQTTQPTFTNIIDAAVEIKVKRRVLDASPLTATLSGATYDPSTNPLLSRGAAIRLSAYDATSTTWEQVFTGFITDATADYYTLDDNPAKVYTRVTVEAADIASPLANTAAVNGVMTLANLRYLFSGKPAPWFCGSSAGTVLTQFIGTAGLPPMNGSILDAIVLARDTESAVTPAPRYAWVSRQGIIRGPLSDPMAAVGTSVIPTFGATRVNCGPVTWANNYVTMTATAAGAMSLTSGGGSDVIAGEAYTFSVASPGTTTPRAITVQVTWLAIDGSAIGAPITAATGTETSTQQTITGAAITAPANAYMVRYSLSVASAAAGEAHVLSPSLNIAPVQFGDTSAYAPAALLDSYSAVDIGYSVDSLINQVTITDGSSTYGPYVDAASVAKYGAAAAKYTIQPGATANPNGILPIFATTVLATNSTPQRSVRQMTVPVLTDQQRRHAIRVDLCHLVGVMRSGVLSMTNHRVTGIEHTIRTHPSGDPALNTWVTEYTFDPAGVAQVPTVSAGSSASDGGTGLDVSQGPTFQNSWANFGPPFFNAGYHRVAGEVELLGVVKSGAIGTIFNLPAGFRPPFQRMFTVGANNQTARIDITTGGDVVLAAYGTGGSNAFVSLDGIRFGTI